MVNATLFKRRTARDPAYAWVSESPNFVDFQTWVQYMMGVPEANLPDVFTMEMAFDESLNLALDDLATITYQPGTPSIYALAVYNLGAAILLDIAQDPEGSTYWSDLRNRFGVTTFAYSILTGSSDQGTSKSSMVPNFVQEMGPLDFWLMQTPWGRQYIMIAGAWGTVWGIS